MACGVATHGRRSRGVMGRGTESFTSQLGVCGNPSAEGSDMCGMHVRQAERMAEKLAAKKARG